MHPELIIEIITLPSFYILLMIPTLANKYFIHIRHHDYLVLLYEGLLTMTIYLPLLHGPGIYSNHDGLLTIFVMASHFYFLLHNYILLVFTSETINYLNPELNIKDYLLLAGCI